MSSGSLKNEFNPKPAAEEALRFLCAAANGDNRTVSAFLARYPTAIDSIERSNDGFSALMLATFYNQTGTVELLLEKGADFERKNYGGCSALDIARLKPDCASITAQFQALAEIRKKQQAEQRLAAELDEITKTIMGGIKKPLRLPRIFK